MCTSKVSAYQVAAELSNEQYKNCFRKRRHGTNSNVYSITAHLERQMVIQFLGEQGEDPLPARLYKFPLEVWFNLIDKQQAIDHNINCLIGNDEWDIGTEDSNWTSTLLFEENGAFTIKIEEHTESNIMIGQKTVINQREWTYLKDCMLSSDLHPSSDTRLGIYVFSEVLKSILHEMICETCSACENINSKKKRYGLNHTCITKKREKQVALYQKAFDKVQAVSFSDRLRSTAIKYDIYVHAPYMLYHIISRFYMESVKELTIEPEGVFATVQGKNMHLYITPSVQPQRCHPRQSTKNEMN